MVHCHHQNGFSFKMCSNESSFYGSLVMRVKVTKDGTLTTRMVLALRCAVMRAVFMVH